MKITFLKWLSVADQNKHRKEPLCLYAGFSRLIPDEIRMKFNINTEKEFCVIYEVKP